MSGDAPIEVEQVIIEDHQAPEIYASYTAAITMDGPNVRITFASTRQDVQPKPNVLTNVIVARIVMPAYAADHLGEQLRGIRQAVELNLTQKPVGTSVQ